MAAVEAVAAVAAVAAVTATEALAAVVATAVVGLAAEAVVATALAVLPAVSTVSALAAVVGTVATAVAVPAAESSSPPVSLAALAPEDWLPSSCRGRACGVRRGLALPTVGAEFERAAAAEGSSSEEGPGAVGGGLQGQRFAFEWRRARPRHQ